MTRNVTKASYVTPAAATGYYTMSPKNWTKSIDIRCGDNVRSLTNFILFTMVSKFRELVKICPASHFETFCWLTDWLIDWRVIVVGSSSVFRRRWPDADGAWLNDQLATEFDVLLQIRSTLNALLSTRRPRDHGVTVTCSPPLHSLLQVTSSRCLYFNVFSLTVITYCLFVHLFNWAFAAHNKRGKCYARLSSGLPLFWNFWKPGHVREFV